MSVLTFNNGNAVVIAVYRNAHAIDTAGGMVNGSVRTTASTTMTYPALSPVTYPTSLGTGWFAGLAIHKSATNVSTAPAGMTNFYSSASGKVAAHDTAGTVAVDWSSTNVTVNASDVSATADFQIAANGGTVTQIAAYSGESASIGTIVIPASWKAGDLLVALTVQYGSGEAAPADAGWTTRGSTSSSNITAFRYYQIAAADSVEFIPTITRY